MNKSKKKDKYANTKYVEEIKEDLVKEIASNK